MAETLQIKRLHPEARLPKYMTGDAAGMDLTACLEEPMVIPPGKRALVPTGLAMAIPAGFEGQVRPRSGLAAKHGISCLNSPGTIDADYRGEVKVILVNHGDEPFTVRHGERIAQLVLARVNQLPIAEVVALDDTARGEGGFGSTGVAS